MKTEKTVQRAYNLNKDRYLPKPSFYINFFFRLFGLI